MRVLIFGTGRVGASIAPYASHLGNEVSTVSHAMAATDPSAVRALIKASNIVAAAIPDDRLRAWWDEWRTDIGKRPAIHFSGAVTIEGVRSYHPLYSFPAHPLDPAIVGKIAIAREEGAPPFASAFPGAPNPEFVVTAGDRPYYHALAVLSGNFAAHLWNEAARGFAGRFGLPPEAILSSYLSGVVDRFRENPLDSMTGPVARRDTGTVAANLEALEDEPRLKALYEAFLESAWPGYGTKPGKRP